MMEQRDSVAPEPESLMSDDIVLTPEAVVDYAIAHWRETFRQPHVSEAQERRAAVLLAEKAQELGYTTREAVLMGSQITSVATFLKAEARRQIAEFSMISDTQYADELSNIDTDSIDDGDATAA
jgi:hypothetical protein